MSIQTNPNYMSVNVKAIIKPLHVPLKIWEEEEERWSNIVKMKMRYNPSSAGSETYKWKMASLENVKL